MNLHNLIDRPDELLQFIATTLTPKQKEKEENGEVFTPMSLIFEMLDQLEQHYLKERGNSIFSEKDFKWFEPSSGIGNFQIAVYSKLMEGLKSQIPNDEKRKQHIIEKMLFMSELNKVNTAICRKIFNGDNKYKLNLHTGDTLRIDTEKKWGVPLNGFNVILGNPPFNKGGIRSCTRKRKGKQTTDPLWTKFIEKAFEWVKADGFIAFINPLTWLRNTHFLHTTMLYKHIVWMKLWDSFQSKYMINAAIPISSYVLQNTSNTSYKKTEIIAESKRINVVSQSLEYLDKEHSIPLALHSILKKLEHFIKKHNCALEYETKVVKSKGEQQPLPEKYTVDDMWAIDTYTLKEGIMVKKALVQHPDAGKRKIIMANKTALNGVFIDDGRLSLTGTHKFYILGNHLESILKVLKFDVIRVMCHCVKYGQDFLFHEIFQYIPDVRKLGLKNLQEDEFCKMIGLTDHEREQIRKSVSNGTIKKRVRKQTKQTMKKKGGV